MKFVIAAALTATFLGETEVFELNGPALTIVRGSEGLHFRRC